MIPNRIHEIAKKYVEYDMIQAHTELPAFPDLRVRLLFAILNQQSPNVAQSELYSLVVSLVQLGMDTHDLIDLETDKRSESEMRSRQLKVLAGDYFSSQFYRLLAQAGQTDMIAAISSAVCEVNRMKVKLYIMMSRSELTAEDYFAWMAGMKSKLFDVFAGKMAGQASSSWPVLLQGMCRCEVALDEMERCESPTRFYQSWAYWHVLENGTEEERQALEQQHSNPAFLSSLLKKYGFRGKLGVMLQSAADEVQAAAAGLHADMLVQEFLQALESYTGRLAGAVPALNETR
ncbi:heptaprenyl diphosphate synthase component 1 [Paenibacillus gorillae]|uniref:heptaprenyl diphosphate synthase component 1 n=1 Tax=Paenibacillus gorillae TaxID=1243662 RepID=UPI0004ACDA94|nr:heptaprenyl diphosphate synthase component 1 [Paenibacillus gorillae]